MPEIERRLWLQLAKEKGDDARALRNFMYSATGIYVHEGVWPMTVKGMFRDA